MPQWPGFLGGSNPAQSLLADGERAVNLYLEPTQSKAAPTTAGLYTIPGYQAWSTQVAEVGARAALVANQRCFWVMGTTLEEYSTTGVPTSRGTVAQDSNPAQMVYNGVVGNQLGIVSGGNVYSLDLATNVLTGPHLSGGYTHIGFVDGYGLAFNPTTGKVNLSNLNDLSTWSAGNYFQRSKFPDPWQAMFVDSNGLIWLPGTETFEAWYDTGTGTQPFAPLSGLYAHFGIAAPFAYAVTPAGLFWLSTGNDGGLAVVMTRGGIPQIVSTYAVNGIMSAFQRDGGPTAITTAEIVPYVENGHTFINLNFPAAPTTVPYAPTLTLDAETKVWTERGVWDVPSGRYGVWGPRATCSFQNKHLIGTRTSGSIYWMDAQFGTEIDGSAIRWMRQTPAIVDEYKRLPINTLQLFMDVGIAGQGANPAVALQVSDDGGRTFGNELQAGTGRVGQYLTRVYWNRLGAGPNKVIRMVGTNVSPARLLQAWVNNTESVSGQAA